MLQVVPCNSLGKQALRPWSICRWNRGKLISTIHPEMLCANLDNHPPSEAMKAWLDLRNPMIPEKSLVDSPLLLPEQAAPVVHEQVWRHHLYQFRRTVLRALLVENAYSSGGERMARYVHKGSDALGGIYLVNHPLVSPVSIINRPITHCIHHHHYYLFHFPKNLER